MVVKPVVDHDLSMVRFELLEFLLLFGAQLWGDVTLCLFHHGAHPLRQMPVLPENYGAGGCSGL